MNEVGISDERDVEGASPPPEDSVALIRRYMQIQQEIAALEKEREQLRDSLVNGLEGKVPQKWNSLIDGKTILVVHRRKITVHYDERILRDRLGSRYAEILEIDGAKIRKNRDLVRPFLAPVLDRIGTPTGFQGRIPQGSYALHIHSRGQRAFRTDCCRRSILSQHSAT